MADRKAEESISNAQGYVLQLMDFLEGRTTLDPEDTQTSEECLYITADVLDHDPELAGMIVRAGLKVCRLLPDQAHWRKSASLAGVYLGQKVGGYSPETLPILDDDLRELHEDFPDDPFVLSHWYALIAFRITSETKHAPDEAPKTLDRLKSLIGDVETVTDEFAGQLASALSTLVLSVNFHGTDEAVTWGEELMALRERFPENSDVVSRADDTMRMLHIAVAEAVEMQRRRDAPLGRLKRLFGF